MVIIFVKWVTRVDLPLGILVIFLVGCFIFLCVSNNAHTMTPDFDPQVCGVCDGFFIQLLTIGYICDVSPSWLQSVKHELQKLHRHTLYIVPSNTLQKICKCRSILDWEHQGYLMKYNPEPLTDCLPIKLVHQFMHLHFEYMLRGTTQIANSQADISSKSASEKMAFFRCFLSFIGQLRVFSSRKVSA